MLRDTVTSRNQKIAELEAESIRVAKENIYLNAELDQEAHRNVQARPRVETPNRRHEAAIAQYDRRTNALEAEIRRLRDKDSRADVEGGGASKVDLELLLAENESLRGRLEEQNALVKKANERVEAKPLFASNELMVDQRRRERPELHSARPLKRKMAAKIIASALLRRSMKKLTRAFSQLRANSLAIRAKLPAKAGSPSMESESKLEL